MKKTLLPFTLLLLLSTTAYPGDKPQQQFNPSSPQARTRRPSRVVRPTRTHTAAPTTVPPQTPAKLSDPMPTPPPVQAGPDLGAVISKHKGPATLVISGGHFKTRASWSNFIVRAEPGLYTSEVPAYLSPGDGGQLQCVSRGAVFHESSAPDQNGAGLWLDASTGAKFLVSVHMIFAPKPVLGNTGGVATNVALKGCTLRGARKDFSSAYETVALGNCHDCEVSGNHFDRLNAIALLLGGNSKDKNFAADSRLNNNTFTQCVSQNLAVVNAVRSEARGNRFVAPGKLLAPGSTVIDIEPNVGDRVEDVVIEANHIDASDTPIDPGGPKVTNGIAVNAGNPTAAFRNVRVVGNTIIGARHAAPHNRITYAGILVRSAPGVTVERNTVRRANRGIVIDFGSRDFRVEGNTLIACGTGGTYSASIENSHGGRFISNELRDEPGDALKLGPRALNIVEVPPSDDNLFQGNRPKPTVTGKRSRVVQ